MGLFEEKQDNRLDPQDAQMASNHIMGNRTDSVIGFCQKGKHSLLPSLYLPHFYHQ